MGSTLSFGRGTIHQHINVPCDHLPALSQQQVSNYQVNIQVSGVMLDRHDMKTRCAVPDKRATRPARPCKAPRSLLCAVRRVDGHSDSPVSAHLMVVH